MYAQQHTTTVGAKWDFLRRLDKARLIKLSLDAFCWLMIDTVYEVVMA